jgi:putative solute:sodium symporter small subunit
MNSPETSSSDRDRYWKQCLNVVYIILGIWAFISLGCGVLFREFLDKTMPNVGHAPFGFWMAQQGAIIGFLTLLFVYMIAMNRLDRRHGFGKDDE